MNKRARNRLVAVTVVILVAVVTAVLLSGTKQGAVYSDVDAVTSDSSLVGKRVKVGGTVVAGSWDKKSNPMSFTIRAENDTAGTGPTLEVVYTGAAPSTFGDDVVAILTGELGDDRVLRASEMITKCPSKYQSATDAMPIKDLVGGGESLVGKPVKASGYVKPGSIKDASSEERFSIAENADGSGVAVPVVFAGGLADGVKDGVQVIVSGEIDESGRFIATSVALSK